MNELERAVESLDDVIKGASALRAVLLQVPQNDGDPGMTLWAAWVRQAHMLGVNANVAGLRLMEACCAQAAYESQCAAEWVGQEQSRKLDNASKEVPHAP